MSFRASEHSTELQEIDRFDGGVGWIAHPEESMRRASHALVADDEVWVIDPVDSESLDDLLAEFGEVAGVVVLFDRHRRDVDAIANRHDVPVYFPDWFDGVADEIAAPVSRFGAELANSGLRAYPVSTNRFWQEAALYDPEDGTLVVPETVGTASYFRASGERLGVHPAMRAFPPRERLGQFEPERILVGHGAGIDSDATAALESALANARRTMPRLYAETIRQLFPL